MRLALCALPPHRHTVSWLPLAEELLKLVWDQNHQAKEAAYRRFCAIIDGNLTKGLGRHWSVEKVRLVESEFEPIGAER
ncbi:MAG: hypothetical protein KGS61_14680 [Verrucomicrobia bacterium]|nr:hypothetical protein [Verrucomicrobiota bacterium]